MRRYKCDPRWINVRFEGKCVRCKRPIRTGERAFYYPEDRSLYCEGEECGKAASQEFFGTSVRRGKQHFDVGSEGRCIKEIAAVAARR